MPITLDKLARTLGTTTVTLRGEEVAVRALSAREEHLLDRVYERPGMPMIADPKAGSQSDRMVPDPTDTAYRRAMREYTAESTPALVAVACDLEVGGERFSLAWEKDMARARKWCNAAREFVLDDLHLTRAEMDAVLQASDNCVKNARAEAGKPSSSGAAGTVAAAAVVEGPSSGTASPIAAG